MSYIGTVFIKSTLPLDCRELPTVLTIAWTVGASHGIYLDKDQIRCNLFLVLKVSMGYGRCPVGALSSPFFGNFIQIIYMQLCLIQRFHCIIFHIILSNGFSLAVHTFFFIICLFLPPLLPFHFRPPFLLNISILFSLLGNIYISLVHYSLPNICGYIICSLSIKDLIGTFT